MANAPQFISEESFQEAWVSASRLLAENSWDLRNLVVQIADPTCLDPTLHQEVRDFAKATGVLGPKHVAYTIFPHRLIGKCQTAERMYHAYNREGGMFDRLLRRSTSRWGTYFRRMTHYETPGGVVNQLERIINAVRSDSKTYAGAFSMVIQKPGGEMTRRRGGPCLNYIAVQMESETPPVMGLLCVYRSHDFLERAYGNYWGLCNLLAFMAEQTGSEPGPLTCISSRAFVSGRKTELNQFLDALP